MVDLHSHILFGIDDGPKTYEESVRLIEMEIDNCVDTVALTPHFCIGHGNPEEFLEERDKLTTDLISSISASGLRMTLIQAAEVRLSPELIGLSSIKSFCYAGEGYMLVELPLEYYYDWIPIVLYELRLYGITPVLAHVERYSYFYENSKLLADLVSAGCMAQVNAGSLVDGSRSKQRFVFSIIQKHLVQVMATDAHSVEQRPPKLEQAMGIVVKKFGIGMAQYFDGNSKRIAAAAKPVTLGR